jgi:hypothetical protein
MVRERHLSERAGERGYWLALRKDLPLVTGANPGLDFDGVERQQYPDQPRTRPAGATMSMSTLVDHLPGRR